MRIQVNGQWLDQPDDLDVAALLVEMSLEPRRVAVELNKQLVPRSQHDQTPLKDQDQLEIVTLVGGG